MDQEIVITKLLSKSLSELADQALHTQKTRQPADGGWCRFGSFEKEIPPALDLAFLSQEIQTVLRLLSCTLGTLG